MLSKLGALREMDWHPNADEWQFHLSGRARVTIFGLAPCVSVDPNQEIGVAWPHIKFKGANIHIESGSGTTTDNGNPLGPGNLIIGYDDDPQTLSGGGAGGGPPLRPGDRGGSHNLVIGRGNRFTQTAFGGLVAGDLNAITGISVSVTGGSSNTANGQNASVSGGIFNTADGQYASVSGGIRNTASGSAASVSGGLFNSAGGQGTMVIAAGPPRHPACRRAPSSIWFRSGSSSGSRSAFAGGVVLPWGLLCAFGTDRKRFEHASELSSLSGTAPARRAGGKKAGKNASVHFSHACPKFLRQSFHEFAGCSIRYCSWAQACYQSQRARGKVIMPQCGRSLLNGSGSSSLAEKIASHTSPIDISRLSKNAVQSTPNRPLKLRQKCE